jgi:CPA1 family monovalent cation:H+ antiporter
MSLANVNTTVFIILFIVATAVALGVRRLRIPYTVGLVLAGMLLGLAHFLESPHLTKSMTFGVVLISILLQGLTMPPLLRWLGIIKCDEGHAAVELAQGKLMAAHAGLEALDRMTYGISTAMPQLREEYKEKIKNIEQDIGKMEPDLDQLMDQEERWARRHLLLVEKNRIIDAFQEGRLSQQVYEKLLADIDARLLTAETEM